MPDFDGIQHAMPMRQACFALKKVVDVGAWCATPGSFGVTERLGKEAFLGVRFEVESIDDILG